MKLIIVESPTKGKTIQKFLGAGYKVQSSFGHVRDLPKSELGVDIEDNFKPKYVVPLKAKKTISYLKKEAEGAEATILATDEDREGESIAWHLSQVLGLENPKRIVFHEITKPAIEEALANPRTIDINLVDAQQARRILDRIVGYKISPFLWKKVARGLSAGRVQSVAVRLVAEREKEIQNFVPQEYWTIVVKLHKFPISNTQFPINELEALLIKKNDKTILKFGIKTKKEADKIIKELKGAEYKVENIEKKETKRNPLPPFTTSSLQQEAWQRFRFPAKFTMSLAQQLYEKGYITYHRTDSLNLSSQSLFCAKKFIEENYGKGYWAGFFRKYKAKGKTQEAHEAIRPAQPNFKPRSLEGKTVFYNKSEEKLYDLIWRRFIACQMAGAIFDSNVADIKAEIPDSKFAIIKKITKSKPKNYTFRATGQVLKFDGFLKVYPLKFEEKGLPDLEKGENLKLAKLIPSQHFTEPLPRYTEATLIKTLEENGIGRPSTYAPILSTVQERNYISKDEKRRFFPTEIGILVNDILVKHFPEIVDIKFTAKMEEELDQIAEGKEIWTNVCRDFYLPFEKNLAQKYKKVSKKEISGKETKKKCPKCGSPLVVRFGKYGKFYACSKFPQCRYTESLEKNALDIKCPKCQEGQIVGKRTKRGKIFYGCNRYPKCDFALWNKPTGEKCPKCGSLLIEDRRRQKVCSKKDCRFNKKVAE